MPFWVSRQSRRNAVRATSRFFAQPFEKPVGVKLKLRSHTKQLFWAIVANTNQACARKTASVSHHRGAQFANFHAPSKLGMTSTHCCVAS